jgi:hypothetical protein
MSTKIFIEDPKDEEDEENEESKSCLVCNAISYILTIAVFLLFLVFCYWAITADVSTPRGHAKNGRTQQYELIPIIDLYTLTRFSIKNVSKRDCELLTITVLRIEEQGNYTVGRYELNNAYAEVITEFGNSPIPVAKNYKVNIESACSPKTEWVCLVNQPCRIMVEAI